MSSELIPRNTVVEICSLRDAALSKMGEAVALIKSGKDIAEDADALSKQAYGASMFNLQGEDDGSNYKRIFSTFNPEESLESYRKLIDARIWMHLVSMTGMSQLMDRTAKEELHAQLCSDVPKVSVDAVYQAFESLMDDSQLIFQRGLARVFSDLDPRFKSHDAFKIGTRIILTNIFNGWGSWNYYSRAADTLKDIERVFDTLDGKKHGNGSIVDAVTKDRGGEFSPRQSYTETDYFRIRTFKNGNAHLWFTRDDLVERANLLLAEYYGEVLPDTGAEDGSVAPLKSKAGLPAKKLSFYPTPDEVTKVVLRNIGLQDDSIVLEPSAGEGNMVKQILLTPGVQVHAVEIDPTRTDSLRQIQSDHLTVIQSNFLQMPVRSIYSHVVMNPPFYGTHWMEHVTHAYDFLAPGGTLVAVLPVTAVVGETKRHKTFRAWAKARSSWNNHFHDLPAESFKDSGTRINTVILTIHKQHQH